MSQSHASVDTEANVDMTPMLDVVFILLIFFIVTTTFLRSESLSFNRPKANPAPPEVSAKLLHLRVSDDNQYWLDQRAVDPRLLAAQLQKARAGRESLNMLIEAAHQADTDVVIQAVDLARAAGIEKVSVATFD